MSNRRHTYSISVRGREMEAEFSIVGGPEPDVAINGYTVGEVTLISLETGTRDTVMEQLLEPAEWQRIENELADRYGDDVMKDNLLDE